MGKINNFARSFVKNITQTEENFKASEGKNNYVAYRGGQITILSDSNSKATKKAFKKIDTQKLIDTINKEPKLNKAKKAKALKLLESLLPAKKQSSKMEKIKNLFRKLKGEKTEKGPHEIRIKLEDLEKEAESSQEPKKKVVDNKLEEPKKEAESSQKPIKKTVRFADDVVKMKYTTLPELDQAIDKWNGTGTNPLKSGPQKKYGEFNLICKAVLKNPKSIRFAEDSILNSPKQLTFILKSMKSPKKKMAFLSALKPEQRSNIKKTLAEHKLAKTPQNKKKIKYSTIPDLRKALEKWDGTGENPIKFGPFQTYDNSQLMRLAIKKDPSAIEFADDLILIDEGKLAFMYSGIQDDENKKQFLDYLPKEAQSEVLRRMARLDQ